MTYPIAVARYDEKHPADVAVCGGCLREYRLDPAEGDPYDRCLKCEVCGGQIMFKYQETDRCRNCGKLEFGAREIGGCCSRRCALQWQYAQTIHHQEAS